MTLPWLEITGGVAFGSAVTLLPIIRQFGALSLSRASAGPSLAVVAQALVLLAGTTVPLVVASFAAGALGLALVMRVQRHRDERDEQEARP